MKALGSMVRSTQGGSRPRSTLAGTERVVTSLKCLNSLSKQSFIHIKKYYDQVVMSTKE